MKFNFKSINRFKRNLGELDAIVEFTEIAVRDFVKKANYADSFNTYLERKSKEHSICVNSINNNIFQTRISHSYIVSTYQVAEDFFYQFKDEHNDFFDTKWSFDKDSEDNLLIQTIKQISTKNKALVILGEHRIQIFNYYRNVRNKFSHTRIKDDKINKEFLLLKDNISLIQTDYPKLNAPNDYNNISFDDFILFTRILKDIISRINMLLDISEENILNYCLKNNILKKFQGNEQRKSNALKGYLKTNFGIADEIADNILESLMLH